jgi:hypothetical protein
MSFEVMPGQSQFAEGTIDLASGIWICDEHRTRVRIGADCLFCLFESGVEIPLSELEDARQSLTA